MNYIEIEINPISEHEASLLEKMIERLIPSANPDISHLIHEVKFWWLESDDSGLPTREIGFNRNREPIVLAPVGKNIGFLIDSSDNWLNYSEHCEQVAKQFDQVWNALWPQFEKFNSV